MRENKQTMNLSKHFTYRELTRSDTAARWGIDNTPKEKDVYELKRLCETILEPLRAVKNKPIIISSGFRCHKLNKKINGAKNSQHILGQAADFTIPGVWVDAIVKHIIILDLPFHQLISEFDRWVHVSTAPEGVKPRRQVLRALKNKRGKTYYEAF